MEELKLAILENKIVSHLLDSEPIKKILKVKQGLETKIKLVLWLEDTLLRLLNYFKC